MAAVVKGFLLLENPYEDVYVETLRAIFRKKIDQGSELVLTCNSDKFFQLLDFYQVRCGHTRLTRCYFQSYVTMGKPYQHE